MIHPKAHAAGMVAARKAASIDPIHPKEKEDALTMVEKLIPPLLGDLSSLSDDTIAAFLEAAVEYHEAVRKTELTPEEEHELAGMNATQLIQSPMKLADCDKPN